MAFWSRPRPLWPVSKRWSLGRLPRPTKRLDGRWPRCSVGHRGSGARSLLSRSRLRSSSSWTLWFARRWLLIRDLLIALALVAAVATVLAQVVDSEWAHVEVDPLSLWGFPDVRIACVGAVIAVARPELVHPVRLLAIWLVGLASLGAVALGIALPADVLAGLAVGLGAGAVVRLALGSPLGAPPVARVRAALSSLGVDIGDLRIGERQQRGAADYFGHGDDGRPLKVRVLGRDAQDTQRLARRWRLLAYRDPPRSAPVGRLEQVEHEAVTTMMAAKAGVRVPGVVTAGLGPDGDALLVTLQPDLAPLEDASPEQVSDELLVELCRQVGILHDAGISHGRLNLSNVLVVDGEPLVVDLSAASLGAPQSTLDIDVAELLVSCCVLVGPERALRTAVDAGWSDSIARALPYLQRAALTPHLRDLARTHEVGLKELRAAAAAATGTAEPEIAPLRRVRPKDVLTMAALIVAAYVLITRLAAIGFDTIGRELKACRPRMGGRSPAHRSVRIRRVGHLRAGSRAVAAPAPALCRASVGDQVHQPGRAELRRSNRDEPAVSPADGGPARAGAGLGRRRRRVRDDGAGGASPDLDCPGGREHRHEPIRCAQ